MDCTQDILIFLGPPGAGKGSLSRLCVERLGWQQISTGNVLRHHIAQRTELGKAVQEVIDAGKLVSDELVAQLVHDWLTQPVSSTNPVILDGFPRTANQARLFEEFVSRHADRFRVRVIHLAISLDALVERLEHRIVCSDKGCQTVYSLKEGSKLAPQQEGICDLCQNSLIRRADDEIAAVRQRLSLYQTHEQELLEYLQSVNRSIVSVPVDRELLAVFQLLTDKLEEKVL